MYFHYPHSGEGEKKRERGNDISHWQKKAPRRLSCHSSSFVSRGLQSVWESKGRMRSKRWRGEKLGQRRGGESFTGSLGRPCPQRSDEERHSLRRYVQVNHHRVMIQDTLLIARGDPSSRIDDQNTLVSPTQVWLQGHCGKQGGSTHNCIDEGPKPLGDIPSSSLQQSHRQRARGNISVPLHVAPR